MSTPSYDSELGFYRGLLLDTQLIMMQHVTRQSYSLFSMGILLLSRDLLL